MTGTSPRAGARRRAVPILTYHSLDDSGSVISTPPSVFRRQMQILHEKGFQALRLEDAVAAWTTGDPLPARPVVLTFDDGFRNVLEHAAPVLGELGFGATVFVVAGHCGGKNDWYGQISEVPILPLLTWTEVRQLADAGFGIGSHSSQHGRLDRLSGADAEAEVAGSKKALEDRLGRPVTTFAYPYGLAGEAARRLVAANYAAACSVELGVAREDDDRHWLRRVEMFYFTNPSVFRLFGTPLGAAYLGLRGLARSARAFTTTLARPRETR
jgi:peptidoglycan/xylan/chitin deacetylase (PgdA/CDA1 family)